jgi:hypothetical protein
VFIYGYVGMVGQIETNPSRETTTTTTVTTRDGERERTHMETLIILYSTTSRPVLLKIPFGGKEKERKILFGSVKC